jgi:four helix bundle suffix protein
MDELIKKHGGYQNLICFNVAQLVYDITLRFCNKFIGTKSRTHDQMVQAARSGVQNIAEGSQASATSKKTELKLTNVARSSLEDFLRQRDFILWKYNDPRVKEIIDLRLDSAESFAKWVMREHKKSGNNISEIAANGVLVLLTVACSLLNKLILSQAKEFQTEGGFTERLYNFRKNQRNQSH